MRSLLCLNSPTRVNFEITYFCNLRCNFCYNPEEIRFHGKIKDIKAILKTLKEHGVYNVSLSGGEPLLHPQIKDILEYMYKLGLRIGLVTNGTLISDDLIKLFKKYDFGLGLSIHAGNKELNDKITGVSGSFEKAIKNIKKLHENRINFSVNFTATKLNYRTLYDYAKLIKDLGAKSITVNRFALAGRGIERKDLILSIKEINELTSIMEKVEKDFDIFIGFGDCIPLCIVKNPKHKKYSTACVAGVGFAVINPKGDIRFCSHAIKNIGNILKQDLSNIWKNNDFLRDYRSLRWLPKKCAKCNLLENCLAGCRMSAVNITGELGPDYYLIKNDTKE